MWPHDGHAGGLQLLVELVPRRLVLAVGRVVAEQRERARLRLDVRRRRRSRSCPTSCFLMSSVGHPAGLLRRRAGCPRCTALSCASVACGDDGHARADAQDVLRGELGLEARRLGRAAHHREHAGWSAALSASALAATSSVLAAGARRSSRARSCGRTARTGSRRCRRSPCTPARGVVGRVVRAGRLQQRVERRVGLRDEVADLDRVGGHAGRRSRRRCRPVATGTHGGGSRIGIATVPGGSVAVRLPRVLGERARGLRLVVEDRHVGERLRRGPARSCWW